jgi:AraC-like DNA-binding protein
VAVTLVRYSSPDRDWELATAAPAPALRGHFGEYCGYREIVGAPLARRELPHSAITLILNLGEPLLVDGRRYASFVAGLHEGPVRTEHPGQQYGIQLDLPPLTAYTLLGRPLGELGNAVVGLDDLLGRAADGLVEALAAAPDWATRFRLLDRALAARLDRGPRAAPEVGWAWRQLCRSAGRIGVAELTAATGWSHRHLAARFRQQVGLPPKAFGRVLRFQRAVGLLHAPTRPTFAEIAATCGYFDQAHLNRDFRDLAGATPTALRAEVNFFQDGVPVAA